MTENYTERHVRPAQSANGTDLLAAEPGANGSQRIVTRFLCGLWFSFLLVVWPSSDWIGLLVLSQALLAAACLLKTSSPASVADTSAGREPIRVEQGGDHAQ